MVRDFHPVENEHAGHTKIPAGFAAHAGTFIIHIFGLFEVTALS